MTSEFTLQAQDLGNKTFLNRFQTRYAYMTGAMANGISGCDLLIAMGKAGLLSSYGSAGLALQEIEAAIKKIQNALPKGPYCFNLIHQPQNLVLEQATIELYLRYQVPIIEVSAFMDLSTSIIQYRASGLFIDNSGAINTNNHIIAKISHPDVAEKFMLPAPQEILNELLQQKRITKEQAQLAQKFPLADCITVEADSAGHTDNQSLCCLFPIITALRNQVMQEHHYNSPILLGAAGGISTPSAAAAAFMMGTDYIVTGSINQGCHEADTSTSVKEMLQSASINDITMAPAADMFELGVQVQVLKKSSLFPMRANKLAALYQRYDSINHIPENEKNQIEQHIFKQSLQQTWQQTQGYLQKHHPLQLIDIDNNEKQKMALIFRWYLGQSSSWAKQGDVTRKIDYQVWCGPAMGAFNQWWGKQDYGVVNVAEQLMQETASLFNKQMYDYQKKQVKEDSIMANTIPQQDIENWLIEQISEQMNIHSKHIDTQHSFAEYQLDSAKALVILARLEKKLGKRLSPTIIWNYPNIASLAERLASV